MQKRFWWTVCLVLIFGLFCSLTSGQEERFVDPCPDAGGLYTWKGEKHLGHDYNAPVGTEVKAIADGRVFEVLRVASRCYNPETKKEVSQHFVWIRHRLSSGQYFYALYGHIDPFGYVKKDAEVKRGQPIGKITSCYVWYEGKLTPAPHLHFGVWNSEADPPMTQLGYGPIRNFVNPLEFIKNNTPWVTMEPDWKKYKLGALSFSVPSDWKVIKKGDSFAAGSTGDYRDRRNISFMVGVVDAPRGAEQGKVRIIHYGSSGGKVEEPGTTLKTISLTHLGRLVDSFRTEVAGRPVTVCVLRLTEKEGYPVKGIEFTNWSFNLIEGGKSYGFLLVGADPAFQSTIFKQLVSRIRFSP